MKQPNVFLWLVLTHAGHMYLYTHVHKPVYSKERVGGWGGRRKGKGRWGERGYHHYLLLDNLSF